MGIKEVSKDEQFDEALEDIDEKELFDGLTSAEES